MIAKSLLNYGNEMSVLRKYDKYKGNKQASENKFIKYNLGVRKSAMLPETVGVITELEDYRKRQFHNFLRSSTDVLPSQYILNHKIHEAFVDAQRLQGY